ncbi:MAG: hypothetical protein HETSPECPRED_003917 [Heterodermia speciosa]|uniref:Uncharacterized protein n=1 Tax=Heterodermia speciosa TaxID=116794 RepID=A0A8H3F6R8_9LECA|nr:MAG: hypothetical protein HETSPECPRED_003917 [Heterodermia speciosa]
MKSPCLLILLFTPPTQAILRLKFQHWFPQYEQHWVKAATVCEQELENYVHANRTDIHSPCAAAADCLLRNITGTIQSNFASAQVLLGLVPTILVFLGPSIAEVTALSTYRPLLAILLSLGSPAVNVGKVFRHVDVEEPFVRPVSSSSKLWSSWFTRQNTMMRNSLEALSYMAALAAIANNVRNSMYTDLRTISGWRCGASFILLAWSLLAVIVHGWGALAVRFRLQGGYKPSIHSMIRSTTFRRVSRGKDNTLSEVLFWLASLCAIVHMILGVFELSSLMFISALEALQVFIMYAISALLCQLILLCELAKMREEVSKEADDGTASSGTKQPAGETVDLFKAHTI